MASIQKIVFRLCLVKAAFGSLFLFRLIINFAGLSDKCFLFVLLYSNQNIFKMKKLSILCLIVSIVLSTLYIVFGVIAEYRYERDIYSHWELSDKSSTIDKKCEHIDVFVSKLENSGLNGKYNAVWQQTPDNSFDCNMDALKTLQSRLHEIKGMDVTSFEYQSAIQQITSQEQGEAENMLSVLKGVWMKEYYPIYWNWIATFSILFLVVIFILSIVFIGSVFEWELI